MNKRMQKLAKRQTEIKEEMESLLALVDKEARDFTDVEDQTFAELEAEAKQVKAKYDKEQTILDAELNLPVTSTVHDFDDNVEVEESEPTLPKWNGDLASYGYGVFQSGLQNGRTPESFIGYQNSLSKYAAATGMSTSPGSEGGFLLPAQMSTAIWDAMNKEPDNLLAMTDNYTVEGESLTFNANAETSRATGSRWGGARAYWLAEAGQVTSSKPVFRQVKIEPKQLGVLVYVTDKLLNNSSVGLSQYLNRVASSEINFLVSDAILNGDGSGKPLGIISGGSLVSQAAESGQAADTIVKENIDKMWSRCPAKARNNAVWLINQDCEPQLDNMSAVVGVGGLPVYLPAGGISAKPYSTLKGRPVIPVEYCQTVGTVGDIVLANLDFYCSGTKGGIDTASSMHLKFDYAETAFRFMFEVDGQPWLSSAITPYKGGSSKTLSPFVALASR